MALEPEAKGVRLACTNDNRPARTSGFYALIPDRYEVWTGALDRSRPQTAPAGRL
ncbi:MAG: hypothetical protein R2724_07120 [Bryobacterales bacterium]